MSGESQSELDYGGRETCSVLLFIDLCVLYFLAKMKWNITHEGHTPPRNISSIVSWALSCPCRLGVWFVELILKDYCYYGLRKLRKTVKSVLLRKLGAFMEGKLFYYGLL